MATIRQETNGRKTILVICADQKRRSIRLGKCHMNTAKRVKTHIEALNAAVCMGIPVEKEQAEWLRTIGDTLHDRIARSGLCKPRNTATLKQWIDRYLTTHNIKDSTKEQCERARENLLAYFGADRRLGDITLHQAAEFRSNLEKNGKEGGGKLAKNTVRRRIGRAKQFFNAAIDAGLIDSNPFAKLESTTTGNTARQVFVPSAWIYACMEHAPDQEWRTILALSRFGGLRIPSELVTLRWSDVNLPEGIMTIHASKTEKVRQVPIFPESRPELAALWELADEGTASEFVINRYWDAGQNLRSTFQKIIKRAGLIPWPKLFQNLRASRESELLEHMPAKDVAAWLGHSQAIQMEHYAMARSDIFQRAISEPTPEAAQKAAQHETEHACTEQHTQ